MLEHMQIQVPQDTTFFGVNERKSDSFAVFFGMAEAQNHANASPQWHTATIAVTNVKSTKWFLVRDICSMKTGTRILQEAEAARNLMEGVCIQEKLDTAKPTVIICKLSSLFSLTAR